MKGDKQVIDLLNQSLGGELRAINQYMVYASILSHMGHTKLASLIKKQAIDEMHHAESLINRILLLEGKPLLSSAEAAVLDNEPEAILKKSLEMEKQGIELYRGLIQSAMQARDFVTARLVEGILTEEEEHQDWLETQLDLIKRLGFANYEANLTVDIGE